MAGSVVQSAKAAQQFAVPDLLPWRLFNRVLLARLLYNVSCFASPQAGKLMSVGRLQDHANENEGEQIECIQAANNQSTTTPRDRGF